MRRVCYSFTRTSHNGNERHQQKEQKCCNAAGMYKYRFTRTSQHGTGRLARHAHRKSAMRPLALGLCSDEALSRYSRNVSKCAEHNVLVAHSSATCRQQLPSTSRCGAPRGEASENARSKYSTSSLGSRGEPDRAARTCVARVHKSA